MQRCKLGNSDLDVSIQGLGCMEIAGWYGARDDAEAVATLAMSLSLLKFVGQASLVDDAMLPS